MINLDVKNLVFLLIDVQTMFLDTMKGDKNALIKKYEQLIRFANWKSIPIITTYEHPIEIKGKMPNILDELLSPNHQSFLKYTFSCYKEPDICNALRKYKQVVVMGSETDVCVLQTVQDLLRNDMDVYLIEDCLFSSEDNIKPALKRMYDAGAIPTNYKMFFYEYLETVKNLNLPQKLIFPEELD